MRTEKIEKKLTRNEYGSHRTKVTSSNMTSVGPQCGTSSSLSFNVKYVLMHDNAPSHQSKLFYEFFEHERFTGEKNIKSWSKSN